MQVAQNAPIIVLKKYNKIFKNYCLFFRRGVIKGGQQKTGD